MRQLLAQAAGSCTHEQSYRKCCRKDVIEANLQALPRSAIHGAFPQRRHLLPFEPFFFTKPPPHPFSSHDYAPSLQASTHVTADSHGFLPTGHPPVTQLTSQHPAGTHLCSARRPKAKQPQSLPRFNTVAQQPKKPAARKTSKSIRRVYIRYTWRSFSKPLPSFPRCPVVVVFLQGSLARCTAAF